MNILIYNHSTNPTGGAEINLIKFVKDASPDIRFIVITAKGELADILSEWATVYTLSDFHRLDRSNNRFWFFRLFFNLIRIWALGFRVIRKENPDIIQSDNFHCGLYALIPAFLRRIPFVWYIQDTFPHPSNELILMRFLSFFASKIVCVSGAVRNRVILGGVHPEKAVVIYNNIDLDKFNPKTIPPGTLKNLPEFSGKRLIGYIGLLHPNKGPQVLLEAIDPDILAQYEAKVVIVGDSYVSGDKFVQSIKHFCESRQLPVSFLGFRSDIPEILRDLDILVFPSICEDSLPNILLEASAMETKIIASRVGGVLEILPPQAQWVFDKGDIGQLSILIESILSTGNTHSYPQVCRDYAKEKFSAQSKISAFIDLYRKLIALR